MTANARMRRLGVVLAGFVGLVLVGLAVVMFRGSLQDNDNLASIVSAFGGLVGLGISLVAMSRVAPTPQRQLPELAADLVESVRGQLLDDSKDRGLRDTNMLPLKWMHRRRGESGFVEGSFEEEARQLAVNYRTIASGRLMVLGEPGSGKSVLAMLLTFGLLTDWASDGRVPVLLVGSSWDPVREPLDDWIVKTLAAQYYNGQDDTAWQLYRDGKILPVIDGLDEIPEPARRHAVRQINTAIAKVPPSVGKYPIVVTCRLAEYDDLIKGGAPTLRSAPVHWLVPLRANDVANDLKAVPWPKGTTWTAVYAELDHAPEGVVASALSTPLMVSLARTVYLGKAGDPAELLDKERFPTRHAVEDYLVDRVVDVAYVSGTDSEGGSSRWSAGEARRFLVFLARYLHDHRERELAWWRLADRLVSPWVAPLVGIGLGLVVLVIVSAGARLFGLQGIGTVDSPGVGTLVGVGVAVLTTGLWYGITGRSPGRIAVARKGSLGRIRRGFRSGSTFLAIPTIPLMLGGVVALFINEGVQSSTIRLAAMFVGICIGVICVAGFAMAAHHWLDTIPDRSTRASPLELLRQDRRAAMLSAFAAAVVAAALCWPILFASVVMSSILGEGIATWSGTPGIPEFTESVTLSVNGTSQAIATLIVLPFLTVAILALMTKAWTRLLVARVVLAAGHRLPWRLIGFLADARDRGLLRESGGVYLFRHVRLQEHLAAPDDKNPAVIHTWTPRRHRALAAGLVLLLASTAIATIATRNHLRCASALYMGKEFDRVRIVTDSGNEVCVGVVSDAELEHLAAQDDAFASLSEANFASAGGGENPIIAIMLPLDAGEGVPKRASFVAEGVAAAQRESLRLGRPFRVLLVNTGVEAEPSGVEMERLEAWSIRTRQAVRGAVTLAMPLIERSNYFGRMAVYDLRPGTTAAYDSHLRYLTMNDFARNTLGSSVELDDGDPSTVDDSSWEQLCGTVESLKLLEMDTKGITPKELQENGCGENGVLVDEKGDLADYLRSREAVNYLSISVYYLVERRSDTRDLATISAEGGGPSIVDQITTAAYRAALSSTGSWEYSIHRLSATQQGWSDTVVRS